MNRFLKVAALLLILVFALAPAALAADEGAAPAVAKAAKPLDLAGFGAAIAAGLIAIGAGYGISKFTAAAAEGISRQPSAASSIQGAVNLPLFLLEGVAIIALVVCLLVVFVRQI
ncbi:MAG TPA: F0F1 ATP synthase subunit C [Acidobacteriota bacterium]|nr:F0F1 ATP synthase subunit C [bacterium]HNX18810.1 F0F1 ATP synthase subunit C [Acidobacteriota bacterium]